MLDQCSYRQPLYILQPLDPHFPIPLNHPEDRRLFLRQGAPPAGPLEPIASRFTPFDLVRPPLVSGNSIDLVTRHFAFQAYHGSTFEDTLTQQIRHLLAIAFIQPQFVGNLSIRYIQSHQVQSGLY